eukprot:403352945
METQNAIKLVKELKANKFLPKFNDVLVLDVCTEITSQMDRINQTFADPDFDREQKQETAKLVVENQNLQRNVRCLLAYLNTRADRLHRLAWESGKSMPEHIKEKLTPAEITYYQKYLENIDTYNKSLSLDNNIDLTVDLTPPKDLFIEVRINKDYGTIMLPESGQVNLQKNTTHLLRRSEVDHLVKQGILALVQ